MSVVETHELTKSYRGKRAVDGLNMHVKEGDIYGFVGKNGAGKSTTMKMYCGLIRPTSGKLSILPNNTRPRFGEFSRIGALIEAPGLLPRMSAYDNVMAKALALGIPDAAAQARSLLELVGLSDTGSTKAKRFSLGMKQRLGVALALVGSPDLLLLDEPFNGLDPEATRTVRAALVRLNQERGVTNIISSHVLEQLNRVATCYGVIASGHMVKEFSEEELHEECGRSIRVRTTDSARTLALLEERLPDASFQAQPNGGLSIAGAGITVERVSEILHDTDQTVLELSSVEQDIEDYFVSLMDSDGASHEATSAHQA